jgi:hypothetical protein
VLDDPIPANAVYVPGSLKVLENAGGILGSMTDASGDDIGAFDAGRNHVRLQLGASSSAVQGGAIAIGQRVSIEFCVTINPSVADGSQIYNIAVSTYSGSVISSTYEITAFRVCRCPGVAACFGHTRLSARDWRSRPA